MIPQRGIYTVGNQQFIEKLPALLHATKTGEQVTWSYGDDYFSQYDWTQEPVEHISQLYIERCLQLRDEYDYLILFYSGGADSHNILTHFIKAGIRIDEIFSFHAFEYYDKKRTKTFDTSRSEIQNEWYNTGLPDFKNLATMLPDTKLTTFDYTQDALKFELPDDWLNIVGEMLHVGAHHRISRYQNSGVLNTIEKHKTALIYGVDKPRVFVQGDHWYFAFLDIIASLPPRIPRSIETPNAVTENFYWSDKSRKILQKQSHLLRRFYQTNPTIEPPTHRKLSFEQRQFYDNITRSVVYPFWRENIFQIDKPGSTFFNETETWIFDESKTAREVWWDHYNHIIAQVDPRFLQRSVNNGPIDGFSGFWSKWHKLA